MSGYIDEVAISISRQYFFGKGWKWKVKLGTSKLKGVVERREEAGWEVDRALKRLEREQETNSELF